MADFEAALSAIAQASLQDGISKLVNGFQPSPVSTSGGFVGAGSFATTKYLAGGIASYTSAATISLDPTLANVITYSTSGAAQTNIFPATTIVSGEPLNLIFYQGTSGASGTIVFGAPFKANGNLVTGLAALNKIFTVNFVSDGTNYIETSRVATAM